MRDLIDAVLLRIRVQMRVGESISILGLNGASI